MYRSPAPSTRKQTTTRAYSDIASVLRNPNGNLAELCRRADAAVETTAIIREMLDAPLDQHILAACVDDKRRLVVSVDAPAWASRLRYYEPELLRRLRAVRHFDGVISTVLRVAVGSTLRSNSPPSDRRLSSAAAQHLRRAAESSRDPELKAIFEKLSRRRDA